MIKRGNLIYHKHQFDFHYEEWFEYDKRNNIICYRNSQNYKYWKEYNKNNNEIHYRDTNNCEYWIEYDGDNENMYLRDIRGKEERCKIW